MDKLAELFSSLGIDLASKQEIELDKNWLCFSLNHASPTKDIPVILIEHGPKNIEEIKKIVKKFDSCIVLFVECNIFFLKALNMSYNIILENESEYQRISSILASCNIADATSELKMQIGITKAIAAIPNATKDFDNRGLFSTHYLKSRISNDVRRNIDADVDNVKQKIGKNLDEILVALGWKISTFNKTYHKGKVSILITDQDDFSIRKKNNDVSPSYTAISNLKKSHWVILTNGKKWRLYTNKISATSTNYFEITLDPKHNSNIRYLILLFGSSSYEEKNGITDIDTFFDESKKHAKKLEDNLSEKIMSADGLFLDIVKGILNHDLKKTFTLIELKDAKQAAFKIMYRIWFLAYAESRNLLPVKDEKYKPISLQSIHFHLESYQTTPDDNTCWSKLLKLFVSVRNGSKKYNLPQYNGELFKHIQFIDDISIKNKFIVSALYGLLEKDGGSIDYATLSVRHLGNIFETLMEFSVRQAKRDIMLLEDKKGVKEIFTEQESTYSYKKNDLYLALKGGIALRKMSASYYTPDKIVEFLVKRGLEPIFVERQKFIVDDLKQYKNTKSTKDLEKCIDRLLDIQVLDPSMGSGHFLVEVLNRITTWVTGILKTYPEHPLLEEIECDRRTVILEQKTNGIVIDETLLTHDVLLKRKIMKRCIFGVDLNPMAVELTKLSLWLDSFAIGVPLTYMNHHIKLGDSTIGIQIDELRNPNNHTLDTWIEDPKKSSRFIEEVKHNTDITIKRVQESKIQYDEYLKRIKPHKVALDTLTALKMDENIIPKNAYKDIPAYSRQIADTVSGKIKNLDNDIKQTIANVDAKSTKYNFFHWELEMMDAFTNKRKGFDLIVGNPPWDKIRPNKKEFFGNLDPKYKEKSNEEKNETRKKYEKEYKEYNNRFIEKRNFYKNNGGIGENTDYDLYRLIIERMIQILVPNGIFSMIVPSAIVNSRGATALRKYILSKNILSLYVFENRKKIFQIHSAYRFALVSIQNNNGPDIFPAGFYLQTLNELNDLEEKTIHLSKSKIGQLSPKMNIIYEVKSLKDLQIIQKLYSLHSRLEDVKDWSVDLGRELNIGEEKDRKLLIKQDGWPVLESKNFHQHIYNYSDTKYHADIKKTITRVKTISKFYNKSIEIHENPRLVYRAVSSATNTRTMISCIIPRSVFTTIATYMAIPRIGTFEINSDYHKLNSYLCGIFNSTTFDYMVRVKIDKNVETYHIYDTPVPENFTNVVAKKISKLSAILTLAETWDENLAEPFFISKNEVKDNTLGKRIEITAEIDALAALHYKLTRDEYTHVLKNFKFDDNSFSDEELSCVIEYTKLSKGDRNKHMRRFYGEVYKRAIQYFDTIIDSNINREMIK